MGWQPIIQTLANDGMPPNLIREWIALPNPALSDNVAADLIESDPGRVSAALTFERPAQSWKIGPK